MATVHQRKKALGATLTKKQLSTLGSIVSKKFLDPSSAFGTNPARVKISVEGLPFQVWDYSEDFNDAIDAEIKKILEPPPEPKPKRNRISAIKVNPNG